VADLTGTHTYQLDPKGRMSLPARFRAAFGEGAYLTLGQEGCLYAFPSSEWVRQSEEARATPGSGPPACAAASRSQPRSTLAITTEASPLRPFTRRSGAAASRPSSGDQSGSSPPLLSAPPHRNGVRVRA